MRNEFDDLRQKADSGKADSQYEFAKSLHNWAVSLRTRSDGIAAVVIERAVGYLEQAIGHGHNDSRQLLREWAVDGHGAAALKYAERCEDQQDRKRFRTLAARDKKACIHTRTECFVELWASDDANEDERLRYVNYLIDSRKVGKAGVFLNDRWTAGIEMRFRQESECGNVDVMNVYGAYLLDKPKEVRYGSELIARSYSGRDDLDPSCLKLLQKAAESASHSAESVFGFQMLDSPIGNTETGLKYVHRAISSGHLASLWHLIRRYDGISSESLNRPGVEPGTEDIYLLLTFFISTDNEQLLTMQYDLLKRKVQDIEGRFDQNREEQSNTHSFRELLRTMAGRLNDFKASSAVTELRRTYFMGETSTPRQDPIGVKGSSDRAQE
jgi:hypothetical protein